MAVADATVLASAVDGALLVVDNNHTRKKLLRQSFDALMAVGTNVMGIVLNRVSIRGRESSYTYYYPQRNEGEGRSGRRRKPSRLTAKANSLPNGIAVDTPILPAVKSYDSNGNDNTNGQNGKDRSSKIGRQVG